MTEKELTLILLTPQGTEFEGPVEAVYLPGTAGRFEVLPGHAPIVSTLEKGEIRWRTGGVELSVAIHGGALMLNDQTLTVCAQLDS
jgi:F-type H+-transporting ATPase subunit epsilon